MIRSHSATSVDWARASAPSYAVIHYSCWGESCQISLCWILPVNKQHPSSPMKTLQLACPLTRCIDGTLGRKRGLNALSAWEGERSFTGVPVNRNGELIRNKAMMYCFFFLNRALIHFSSDTPRAFVERLVMIFTGGIDDRKWMCCLMVRVGIGSLVLWRVNTAIILHCYCMPRVFL